MARFSLVKDENLSMIVESSAGKEARVIRLVKRFWNVVLCFLTFIWP